MLSAFQKSELAKGAAMKARLDARADAHWQRRVNLLERFPPGGDCGAGWDGCPWRRFLRGKRSHGEKRADSYFSAGGGRGAANFDKN